MEVTGGGLSSLVSQGLDSMETKTQELNQMMDDFANMSTEDQNANLLKIQFEMGQYNATVELTSSITKSVTDTAKSIAQKV